MIGSIRDHDTLDPSRDGSGRRRIGWLPALPILVLALVILTAVLAPLLAPHPAKVGELIDRLTAPSWLDGPYPLGTDHLGRDVLSRIMFGTRTSLFIGGSVVLLCSVLGTALGLIAGYRGGVIDSIVMRVVDIALALPIILTAIVVAAIFAPSILGLIVILSSLLWAPYARVVRGEAKALRAREFVVAAEALGYSSSRILFLHMLPNLLNTVVVLATLQLGSVILTEASLSFLSIGVPPPTPSWGRMISDGRDFVVSAWWVTFFPGVVLAAVILSTNLLGDWLRDRYDPTGTTSKAL